MTLGCGGKSRLCEWEGGLVRSICVATSSKREGCLMMSGCGADQGVGGRSELDTEFQDNTFSKDSKTSGLNGVP